MTHFADFEFKRDSRHFQPLPSGHKWVCNVSLPSWPDIVLGWRELELPSVYVCRAHAQQLGMELASGGRP